MRNEGIVGNITGIYTNDWAVAKDPLGSTNPNVEPHQTSKG